MEMTRPIGLTEAYSKYCHDHAGGATILAGIMKLTGTLNGRIIQKALERLCLEQPLLRADFIESEKGHDTLRVNQFSNKLPLVVLKRDDSKQGADILEKQMVQRFDYKKDQRLWRVICLLGDDSQTAVHEIIVVFHHSISDGLSLSQFCKKFLEYSSLILNKKDFHVCEFDFPAPVETMLTRNSSWPGFLWRNISGSLQYLRPGNRLNTYEVHSSFEARKPGNLYFEINGDKVDRLVAKCREQKTTMTGFLSAALMKAVFIVMYKGTGVKKNRQINCTPVSLRNFCNPVVDKESIGCFVNFLQTSYIIAEDTDIWPLARLFTRKINRAIDKNKNLPPREYSKFFFEKLLGTLDTGMLKNVFPYGVGVTNIGRLDFDLNIGDYQIESFHFGTARQLGDWLVLLHTSTICSKLFLNFCYCDPLVSREKICRIAETTLSIIEAEAV